MREIHNCPECESFNTEVVCTEWYNDSVERTRICNDCPTEWIVNYGTPLIRKVKCHGEEEEDELE